MDIPYYIYILLHRYIYVNKDVMNRSLKEEKREKEEIAFCGGLQNLSRKIVFNAIGQQCRAAEYWFCLRRSRGRSL